MTDVDPVLARVEAFDREAGGGVTLDWHRGCYTLTLTETDAPIARLEAEGPGDRMRVQYRSSQGRWKDVGDMGGPRAPTGRGARNNGQHRHLLDLSLSKFVQGRAEGSRFFVYTASNAAEWLLSEPARSL